MTLTTMLKDFVTQDTINKVIDEAMLMMEDGGLEKDKPK